MSKEVMKLALEALDGGHVDRAYGYIQEALVKGEEHMTDVDYRSMYLKVRDELAELQQRHWVGLTDEEVLSEAKRFALGLSFPFDGITTPEMFARAIEAKLKEKNT